MAPPTGQLPQLDRHRRVPRDGAVPSPSVARLPPAILDCLLSLPAGRQAIYTERRPRPIICLPTEDEQIGALEELRHSVEPVARERGVLGGRGDEVAGPRSHPRQ